MSHYTLSIINEPGRAEITLNPDGSVSIKSVAVVGMGGNVTTLYSVTQARQWLQNALEQVEKL